MDDNEGYNDKEIEDHLLSKGLSKHVELDIPRIIYVLENQIRFFRGLSNHYERLSEEFINGISNFMINNVDAWYDASELKSNNYVYKLSRLQSLANERVTNLEDIIRDIDWVIERSNFNSNSLEENEYTVKANVYYVLLKNLKKFPQLKRLLPTNKYLSYDEY